MFYSSYNRSIKWCPRRECTFYPSQCAKQIQQIWSMHVPLPALGHLLACRNTNDYTCLLVASVLNRSQACLKEHHAWSYPCCICNRLLGGVVTMATGPYSMSTFLHRTLGLLCNHRDKRGGWGLLGNVGHHEAAPLVNSRDEKEKSKRLKPFAYPNGCHHQENGIESFPRREETACQGSF